MASWIDASMENSILAEFVDAATLDTLMESQQEINCREMAIMMGQLAWLVAPMEYKLDDEVEIILEVVQITKNNKNNRGQGVSLIIVSMAMIHGPHSNGPFSQVDAVCGELDSCILAQPSGFLTEDFFLIPPILVCILQSFGFC